MCALLYISLPFWKRFLNWSAWLAGSHLSRALPREETSEQALERRVRESQEVEERVREIYTKADLTKELQQVGAAPAGLPDGAPAPKSDSQIDVQAAGNLVVLEVESSSVCQTGLPEPELHWKDDKKAALAPCAKIKHSFQRVARNCPEVQFLHLEVGMPFPCRLLYHDMLQA